MNAQEQKLAELWKKHDDVQAKLRSSYRHTKSLEKEMSDLTEEIASLDYDIRASKEKWVQVTCEDENGRVVNTFKDTSDMAELYKITHLNYYKITITPL